MPYPDLQILSGNDEFDALLHALAAWKPQFAAKLAAKLAQYQQSRHEPHTEQENARIDALVSDTAAMQQDIEDAAVRCACFERSLAELQSASETLLIQDAAPAMDTLLVLVNRIESLHRVTWGQGALASSEAPTSALEAIQARAPLVDACKSQSRVVFAHFRSLSEKAKDLTQQFTELATDFTFEISLAQERIGKLRDTVQIAETLRTGVGDQRETWNDHKAAAELNIQQARETIRSAERTRDSRESARTVRNILTFGLGEVFDLFDLNEEIEDAERTVASAEENVLACEQSIQRAMAAIQRIDEAVARLNSLGNMLHDQETTLQASVVHGQSLRTRTIDLTNASLDVTLFVGRLAAKSETLAMHHTAQEFARGVLNIGTLVASDGRLIRNGLLEEDPGKLQETLDLIAQSDPVGDITEITRMLETSHPMLMNRVEDLM